ncbi:MAG: protein kinase [Thermoanaerobaculales bacterium]|nr:protein kinase [Thermoanaerobaculales bacterium]
MTSDSDPWSSTASSDVRRAQRTLELAVRRRLINTTALLTALVEAGLDAESTPPGRQLEVAIERGLIHPTALARLERELSNSDPSRHKTDPFDQLPVEDWDRYELVDFIGRGGMGDVFKARDPRLGRWVAIKFLRRDDPKIIARFVREARIQSRVDHDGVCPVYEVGEVEGHPFIVMQYVAGGALPEVRNQLTLREKVQITADVADALHAAHRLDLVHRDVKPANIMVESTPNGAWRTFVVDFGIAREIDSHDVTQTGAVLGTPAFSAPEQLQGRTKEVDARSDIYSLGATLYWLLTGRAPFEGSYTEILSGHTEIDPTPPSHLESEISRDLDTVTLKCLEIDAGRRYESSFALAEDLRRIVADEPISARRAGFFYQLSKRARRHPVLTTGLVASVIALVGFFGLHLYGQWQEARRTTIAQALLEKATDIESFAQIVAMMPRHDTTAERDIVHRRMDEIRRETESIGELAQGPGRYALGRAHLILGEIDEAVDDLQTAWQSGYRSSAVASALGRALGRAYERELREARHIANPDLRATTERELAVTFRDRALELLRTANDTELEAPAFTEALISYYEGRLGPALEAARQAAETAPWHFQARRLEGDIRLAQATEFAGGGQVEAALDSLSQAGVAYEKTLEIARSDADSLTALCHRWLQEMDLRERHGASGDEAFEHAQNACREAREVAPGEPGPWETSALLLWRRGNSLNDRGMDPGPILEEAERAAKAAIGLNPGSADAHHALGGTLTVAALHAASRGEDPEALLDRAIEGLTTAVAIEPGNAVAIDDLGYAHDRRARYRLSVGRDPREDLGHALKSYQRALELSPNYANAHNNSGIALWRQAVWEHRTDADPEATLAAAERSFQAALELNPQYAYAWANLGMCRRTLGQTLLEHGKDPRPTLSQARDSLSKALDINPSIAYAHLELAAVEIVAIRAAHAVGEPTLTLLSAASTAVSQAIRTNPSSSAARQTSAEVHRWRAEEILSQGLSPRQEIARGLREIDRSLELNPRSWQAMVTAAALYEIEARFGTTATRRNGAVANALRDLEAAVEISPLAEHDAAPIRRKLEQLS